MNNPNKFTNKYGIRRFHGYLVTSLGTVFSSEPWRGKVEMSQHPNSHGYMRVRLVVEGKRKSYFVHKLVMELFGKPRPVAKGPGKSKQYEIRHVDGNRLDNSIGNLLWGTQQDNMDDRSRHGRTSRGPKHSLAIKRGIYNGR